MAQFRTKAVGVPVWCRCHRGAVTGLATSPDGSFLFSSCSRGSLAQYDCAATQCRVLRVAGQAPCPAPPWSPDCPLIRSLWGGACPVLTDDSFKLPTVVSLPRPRGEVWF